MKSKHSIFFFFLVLFAIFTISSVIYLLLGLDNLKDSQTIKLIYLIRLPRLIMAILTGGSLAISGLCFQGLLRNPLATPYTLGVSSGSAFGAVLAIKLNIAGFAIPAAMLMAIMTIIIVYRLSMIGGKFTIATLLLAGISFSFFFSGMILFIHYIVDFTQSAMMIRWMMGGFDSVTYKNVYITFPLVLIFSGYILLRARDLNLICLGDEIAHTRGVNVKKIQQGIFFASSLLTAVIISMTGPIGFVGLIVPHITRYLIGQDYRSLIPYSFLAGGIFLLLSDLIAKTIISPASIPVGVLTAIMGGPFFLSILYRSKRTLYL